MAKQQHAHRVVEEDKVTCECGEEFSSDDLWREHYESKHTEEERIKLEGRDPAAAEEFQATNDEVHAAVVEALAEAEGEGNQTERSTNG